MFPPWQVLDSAIEADKLIEKYETLASDLLQWIEQTILTLNDRQLANSLAGVQNQLQAFNTYRTVEKPPKCVPTPGPGHRGSILPGNGVAVGVVPLDQPGRLLPPSPWEGCFELGPVPTRLAPPPGISACQP